MRDKQEYLAGKKLYGDDFNLDELEEWFKDESEGYANLLGAEINQSKNQNRQYTYHALNNKYGFNFLPDDKKSFNVLGCGSAYGDEFKPILERVDKITILEPSDAFVVQDINKVPVTYVKPNMDGSLPFPTNSFDLITCFGVLHHIANVSTVVGELYRCLRPGGYLLVREPTLSMGDWRKPRAGLTKRERGIPLNIFRQIISTTGFEVINEKRCMFSLTRHLNRIMKEPVYNSKTALLIDEVFCWLFAWNSKYHAPKKIDKLRPTSVFYVLSKSVRD